MAVLPLIVVGALLLLVSGDSHAGCPLHDDEGGTEQAVTSTAQPDPELTELAEE